MPKSPRGPSIDGPSPTSDQPTLPGLDSATSSPGSVDGRTASGSQASPTTPPSGPDRAPASRFQTRARGAESATLDIFGQHGSHSSASVALQSSLESRLRVDLASSGSTLFSLTWNDAVTPSGRRILALRASAHRTLVNDSSSWPTPLLTNVAKTASWPTPVARDHTPIASNANGAREADGKRGIGLNSEAILVGWATPVATEIGNTLENYVAMKRNMRSGPRTAITHPSMQAQLAVPPNFLGWMRMGRLPRRRLPAS